MNALGNGGGHRVGPFYFRLKPVFAWGISVESSSKEEPHICQPHLYRAPPTAVEGKEGSARHLYD